MSLCRSIRSQLAWLIASFVVLTLVSTLLLSYHFMANEYEKQLHRANAVLAETLAGNITQVLAQGGGEQQLLLQALVEQCSAGLGGYACLVDGEGELVAHADRRPVRETYNYRTQRRSLPSRDNEERLGREARDNDAVLEAPPSLRNLIQKARQGGSGFYPDDQGEEYLCTYRSISQASAVAPWSLVVLQKKGAAFGFIKKVSLHSFFLGSWVLLLSLWLTWALAKRFTDPLLAMVEATDRVRRGDMEVRLPTRLAHELGLLAENFNQMVAELGRHRTRLALLVEERTRDLGEANEELRAMNEAVLDTNRLLAASNSQLAAEINVRQQAQEQVLRRERQCRAVTELLTQPLQDAGALLDVILCHALQLVGAPDGYISLYDEEAGGFRVCYSRGAYAAFQEEVQPLETGMEGVVCAQKELLYVPAYADFLQRVEDPRLESLSSVIMLPLVQTGQVRAVLVTSWRQLHTVHQEDVETLRQFADLALVALERVNAQEQMQRLAYRDVLTGLPNRARLQVHLAEQLQREAACGAMFFIDMDELKDVNDHFGHATGDEIILAARDHILAVLGQKAFIARIGGDEFAALLPGVTASQAPQVAAAIVAALHQDYEVAAGEVRLSGSVGAVIYPRDGADVGTLLKKGDLAMYAAKKAGRNCWRLYEPALLAETDEKIWLAAGLRQALEEGELRLHYQPQVRAADGAVTGFEALVRWEQPERGLIAPGRFIPFAEQNGWIVPVGRWVLAEACAFAGRLAAMGYGRLRVAVNISPRQLREPGFVELVAGCLEEAGIAASQLELEITESVLIEAMEENIGKLQRLRLLGVSLSLDDFGTGYSSLTYLHNLPVGTLKIDKSFIDTVLCGGERQQMVKSIVALGHALGLVVLAEGVEEPEQLQALRQMECDSIQGYLFSRPLPEGEALSFLQRREGR